MAYLNFRQWVQLREGDTIDTVTNDNTPNNPTTPGAIPKPIPMKAAMATKKPTTPPQKVAADVTKINQAITGAKVGAKDAANALAVNRDLGN